MSSRRDGRHSGVKIYVGNLPKEENRIISADKISNLFSRCGTVNNIWIAKKPPGFAFVEYADQRDAEDAVKSLNKYEIEPDYPIGRYNDRRSPYYSRYRSSSRSRTRTRSRSSSRSRSYSRDSSRSCHRRRRDRDSYSPYSRDRRHSRHSRR